MKLHYFRQSKPDADDRDLYAACVMGYVPTGCLLGGVVLWKIIRAGERPCDLCLGGPRARCGGTPALTDQEIAARASARDVEQLFEEARDAGMGELP